MPERRPVYLDLFRIRQPLPAVVSILHRITGAALFLLLPFLLYAWELSLDGEEGFRAAQASSALRLLITVSLSFLAYHLLAGLRFLLFDLHRPGSYRHARSSALAVLAAAAAAVLLAVYALW